MLAVGEVGCMDKKHYILRGLYDFFPQLYSMNIFSFSVFKY